MVSNLIDVAPTFTAGAYSSGDVLFITTTVSDAVRTNGGRAILQSITVLDKDDQGIAFDLYLFRSNVSLGTLNEAPSISDADALECLGHVAVASGDYKDVGGAKVATVKNIGLLLEADSGSKSLYVAAVTGGTPTHTASGMELRLGLTY